MRVFPDVLAPQLADLGHFHGNPSVQPDLIDAKFIGLVSSGQHAG